MPFDWTAPQLTNDILFGTRTASFWGGNSTSSMFNQKSVEKEVPVPVSTASYYTKPTPQPFYTVKSLGSASPYADMMPVNILQGREKYGYNVPGTVPFVGPTSVDIYKGKTKVKTEKMTAVQAATVYAPLQAGKEDKYANTRSYYAGRKLTKTETDKLEGVSTKTEKQNNNIDYYQNSFSEKFMAGTWWGR